MSLISIQNLTFSYDGSYDNIFENVSFQIDTAWKLGFTGRNARGKTTFLNLLLNKYEYSGKIIKSVEFEYFPFTVSNTHLKAADVVLLIAQDYEQWQLEYELSLLQFDTEALQRGFNTLSNGEQTKLLIAAMFLKQNSFMLIDEPTNHLDAQGRRLLADYLRGKSGFILVSHDREFLDTCTDHTLAINKTNIEIQQGSFSSWYSNKQMADNYEIEKNAQLKKQVKRLEETAREKAAWANKTEASKIGTHCADRGFVGHKAAKMMKRAKVIEKHAQTAAEEKKSLLQNLEEVENLKIHPIEFHSDTLARLKNLSICYGDRAVCENVSFNVTRGSRTALTGLNGSGKSSILKLLCGEAIPYKGELFKAAGIIISYVQQDTSRLNGSFAQFEQQNNIDTVLFRAILRKLDFSRIQFEKNIEELSAGQRKKLVLARSLCEKAHLYIWDEPLNYIDIYSRMQIEQLICSFKPTMLFVEHDKAFCNNCATQIITL